MKHGSLFSGIGGAELAASWVGWNNVFHCDINEFGNRVIRYHFPESKEYGDITKTDFREWRGKIDVLTGGFPCFKAGTHVMTYEGLKNIENICLGDLILTKRGRYMPCNAIMNKVANEIFGIKAQGLYEPIITTRDHPFFVKRKKGNKATWVNAGDISKGDMIAYRCIDGDLKLKDENYWYMVGRFLGDGWILDGKRKSKIEKGHRGSRINSINHKVIICCNKKESECLKSIILKAGYKYTFSPDRTVDKFIICNQELIGELMKFGRYSFGKKLSKESFRLENSRKKALFEGWLSADGYIEKNGSYKITTVSEELAVGMASIARDVYKCPVSISKKTVNRICKIEGRVVNERPQYCITVSNCNRYGYYKNGFVWCLVKKVYKKLEEVKVYNIGVLEDETYTANGIAVHNCQPFSVAGKRKGKEDDRYLWPEMLRVIRETQPTWVVGENVGGIVSMVQPGTQVKMECETSLFEEDYYTKEEQEYVIETVCKSLECEGYSVQPLLIPACAVGAPHRRDRIWFVAHSNNDGGPKNTQSERIKNFQDKNKYECVCLSDVTPHRTNAGSESEQTREELSDKYRPTSNAKSDGDRRELRRLEKKNDFLGKSEKCRENYLQSWDYGEKRITTNAKSEQSKRMQSKQSEISKSESGKFGGNDSKKHFERNDWSSFPTQSPICNRDDGLSDRLVGITFPKWRNEAIKAMGNAWVPEVAYQIFKVINQIENETEYRR